jgi:protein transport protein DSL1/ZW10
MAMFGLPTLILAMYRTASPYYYSMVEAGNMYLYNDALWLAEQLDSLSKKWPLRPEVTLRLANKVKYGKEVETLEKLGKRAYAKEIATQRTIIKDMLRGMSSVMLGESYTDFSL